MKRSPESPQSDPKSEKSGSDKGFMNRWSQRKRDALSDEAPDTIAELAKDDHNSALVQGDVGNDALVDTSDQDQPVLTDEDMPDIETLNGDSDFSPFLSEGVSKDLRNRALKKLFFSGKFSVRDGLDDYDDDFTYFEPLGDTVTSDMKFHQRRKEKARLAELEEREAEERARLEASESEEVAESETEETINHESDTAHEAQQQADSESVQQPASPQQADNQQTPEEAGNSEEDAPPVV